MVEDVGITASIKQTGNAAHRTDPQQADTEITTEMSDVKLALTQRQYTLLMSVLESLPRALSEVADAEESMAPTPELSTPSTPAEEPTEANVNLEPELAIVKSAGAEPELWTSLDLVFSVKSVALELYTNDAVTQQDLKANSIARFTLVQSQLGVKMLSDGAMEAEFSLKTIAFMSTRAGGSAFRDIIPATDHGGNQVYVEDR
jgi:vacuolar protein sorting-associated protein 13A/C